MTKEFARRLGAEFIGTLLLVLFGAGAFVAAIVFGQQGLGYPGVGFIALSFAFAVAVGVYVSAPVSGAHINPAVTIALAVVRRFPWREVGPYIFAQLVGGLVAGILIDTIFGDEALTANISGGTQVVEGYSNLQAVVAEALGTALVMFMVMALAIDKRAPGGWAGLMIGLAVGAEIMVIGPISNGSVNPARTFGPYASTSIFGGSTPWELFWIYVVGPIVGAIVAGLVYEWFARPSRPETQPSRSEEDASAS